MAKVSLRAYNREIEAMIDRNHLDEAVAHCQHILKTFSKHVETYRLLGKAYLEARRHDEAVDIFTRVLAAVPNDFVAHVGMSIVRDEQNKLDDAIWHMERAYESQSANSAIQAELQRLYGRREGVQPPRVRMTRGALANMYMRGELYPQAISESKGVLEEDPGRSDMQVLLAKAYYKSGQKKDAADAASAVLKRYPFCLDANLVLAEILGTDRPESAQGYRQRAVELDPYASQSDNLFDAAQVSDAAISLDRLDWNGQPAGMTADWRTADAISLESGISGRDEQPDWMKASYPDETPLSAPALESGLEASSQPALPADDIPDFLKAAGWGASTGAFDESKSSAMFDEESAPAAEPLAQGDLPDWIKAMAPVTATQPAEEQAEEIPDWINKIGTSELPIPSAASEETDWISGLGEPAVESQPSAEQPDWMKELGGEQPAPAPAATGDLDWLKELSEEQPISSIAEQPTPAAATDDLDWLKELSEEQPVSSIAEQPAPSATDDLDWLKELEQPVSSTEEQPAPAATDDLDWLKGLDQDVQQPVSASEGQPDWLKGFAEDEQPVSASESQPDWLKGFADEEQPVSASESQPDWLKGFADQEPVASSEFDFAAETPAPEVPAAMVDTGSLGTSEKEQDDSFAWLEALAAKQGATEGLLTKPEERLEQEPDWVQQVKKGTGELQPLPESQLPVEEPTFPEPVASLEAQPPAEPESLAAFEEPIPADEPLSAPTASVEELGRSEAERDDAFVWLEALAAKQGASEGLLTKPEERLEQEPDWVQQVKKGTGELQPLPESKLPVDEPTFPEPVASPEAQPPAEPEPLAAFEEPIPAEEPLSAPTASVEELGRSEAERDDAFAWLEALAAKQGASEGLLTKPEERLEQEPEWVQQVKKGTGELQPLPESQLPVEEAAPAEPEPVTAFEEQIPVEEPLSAPTASVEELGKSEAERDDAFAWLEALAAKQGASEGLLTKPEERLEQEPDWVQQVKKGTGELQPLPESHLPVEEAAPAEPEPLAAFEEPVPAEEIVIPEPFASLEAQPPAEPEPVAAFEEQIPVEEIVIPEPEVRLEQPQSVEDTQPTRVQRPVAEEQPAPVEPEPVSALEGQIPVEEISAPEPEPVSPPVSSVEELGRSEALPTKPEERVKEEPEWVKRLKSAGNALKSALVPPTKEETVPEPVSAVEQAPVMEKAVPAQPEPVSALEEQPPVEEAAPTEPEAVSELEEQPVEEMVPAEPEPASQPMASVEELGKSEAERDDSFAWLEALAAKQGATEGLLTKPEERLEDAPEWVKQAKELREEMPVPVTPPPAEPEPEPEPLADEIAPAEDVPAWVKGLGEVEEEEAEPEPITEDETTAWLRSLDEPEEAEPVTLAPAEDLPAWMQEIEREEAAPAAEPAVPTMEAELPADSAAPEPESAPEELPAWLHGLVEDEQPPAIPVSDDLPAWMRDETGEVVAEPTKIEPTRSTDWAPLDETAEAVEPPPPAPQPAPQPKAAPAPKAKKPAKKETVKPAAEPYREPITAIRGTGMLSMPVDPILASARSELTRSNIPGALDTYGKLIKKGRFLEEVIFDLREALYRYPVEVSIWQALGDAYMRANRLQDALDAYTKAEELLR